MTELEDDDTPEDDGVLDPADSLETDDLRADVLDTGIDAGEGYRGSTRYGTTLAEEKRGESLDDLLAEQEPDPAPDLPWVDENQPEDLGRTQQRRAGRLSLPSEDPGSDEELDLVAIEAGVDGGAASAEEAAVHPDRRTAVPVEPRLETAPCPPHPHPAHPPRVRPSRPTLLSEG